jgi:hypothetical protein
MTDAAPSLAAPLTHRFALCLSGGVALGAYIAGVLTQLYRDLHTINALPEADDRLRLTIDAIAGSSAGSVTGLILARALALESDPQTFERAMRACWVEGLDVTALLSPPHDPANAVFSNDCLERIARQTFAILGGSREDSVQAHPPQTAAEDPSFVPERTIALWMTMTNLDGIPYCIDFDSPGAPSVETVFYARAYRDYAPYFLNGERFYHVRIPPERLMSPFPLDRIVRIGWNEIKEAAATSGAFPLAFPSRPQERDLTLYPAYQRFVEHAEELRRLALTPGEKRSDAPLPSRSELVAFQFVDGGLFNNQPIGRVIDAVSYLERLDSGRIPDKERAFRSFLVIEPDPNTREAIAQSMGADTQAARESPHGLPPQKVLGKIINAYFNDALYSDFERAEKVNQQIRALNRALAASQLTPAQQEAIRQAVGLHYKREIVLERIPAVPPQQDRLAGDFMGHFGGFLAQALREEDFVTGQREARRWFQEWLQRWITQLGERAPITLEQAVSRLPALPEPPGKASPDAGWEWIESERRKAILEALLQRAQQMIGRWLPEARPYLPAAHTLIEPKIEAMYVRGASGSARLDWLNALFRLFDTPLGPKVQSVTGVATALLLLAALGAMTLLGMAFVVPLSWASLLAGMALGGLLTAGGFGAGSWLHRRAAASSKDAPPPTDATP